MAATYENKYNSLLNVINPSEAHFISKSHLCKFRFAGFNQIRKCCTCHHIRDTLGLRPVNIIYESSLKSYIRIMLGFYTTQFFSDSTSGNNMYK